MADEINKRDENRVTTVAGVTDDAGLDITQLRLDPTTKRLKVLQSALSSSVDSVTVETTKYTTQIDEASSTITYIGKATIGSATSSAVWQIQKISVSGNVTSFEFADGDDNFDNIFDNRASLSYS